MARDNFKEHIITKGFEEIFKNCSLDFIKL